MNYYVRKIIWVAAIIFSCLIHSYAYATPDSCSTTGGKYTTSGSLTTQRDMPVGQQTSSLNGAGTVYKLTCAAIGAADRDAYFVITVNASPVSGYSDVYPTNIDGLGVRFIINIENTSLCPAVENKVISNSKYNSTCHMNHGTTTSSDVTSSIIFVKTKAQIASGVVTTIPTVSTSYSMNADGYTSPIDDLWSSASVTITNIACTVASSDITKKFDDISLSKFTEVGSTPVSKDFDVELECDAGTNINVSMAGTQSSETSDSSILALTGAGDAGVAKGVGVQIAYAGVALKLNENIVLKQSSGGMESLPFTARYYQIADKVTAGSANSTATLNITYQ